ncbi:MAG: hypothetical protein OXU20_13675 [Myxococcales bacterium]|nr:hypothetical protein [Myxococcales bacterium]
MASLTQVTRKRRQNKAAKAGRAAKRARVKAGTPKFPIHPQKKQSS